MYEKFLEPDFPRFNISIIIFTIVIALATGLGDFFNLIRPFLISEYYGNDLPEVRQGQIWRLLTPIFLHFSLLHLAFNMLWLWILGRVIENIQGGPFLMLLVSLLGIGSNLGQYYWSGPLFGGMSGVVYGLLGFLWIQGKLNPNYSVRLHQPIVIMMMVWFVLCWSGILSWLSLLLFKTPLEVANMAHTTGLLIGLIWGFLQAVSGKTRRAS